MEILNQFGINPILLLAQVVNFLVLLFILKKFLYKPILKVLGERKQKIEDSLKNAEEIEKRLLETQQESEKVLAKTSAQAQKLMDDTKKELELFREEMRQNAKQEAERIIKEGQESAQAEALRMKQEIMSKMAEIVAVGMEKITGKILNKKEQKDIIEKEVRNLS